MSDGGDPDVGDDPDGGGGHLNGPMERRNLRQSKAKTFGGSVEPRVKVVIRHGSYLLAAASGMK